MSVVSSFDMLGLILCIDFDFDFDVDFDFDLAFDFDFRAATAGADVTRAQRLSSVLHILEPK